MDRRRFITAIAPAFGNPRGPVAHNNPAMEIPRGSDQSPLPRARVALETTLLIHGVPPEAARPLADRLSAIVRNEGAEPALIGVIDGRPIVGMTNSQLDRLLAVASDPANGGPKSIPKVNTGNLGPALFRGRHGATTVSATMELAAAAGVRVFATGGLGGVHPTLAGSAPHFDISADLGAFARFPVAVVTSGVKSILDLAATRELLETLGICVVGYQTDDFPAFYMRRCDKSSGPAVGPVDVRFDDVEELAAFIRFELDRAGRGIVVCNPIPVEHEISPIAWRRWLAAAEGRVHAMGASGRAVTPAILAALHEVSDGATLKANIALIESNARLAAQIAARIRSQSTVNS